MSTWACLDSQLVSLLDLLDKVLRNQTTQISTQLGPLYEWVIQCS